MAAPVLIKPIPPQVINERAAYAPFDLKNYIHHPENEAIHFEAGLASGEGLPKGMICTADGILTGIPAKGTSGNYQIQVEAHTDDGAVKAEFILTIKPSFAADPLVYADELKSQIWQALQNNLPAPEFAELLDRPPTFADIYYLLERWSTLIIWDAFNLDPAGEKRELILPDASPHFRIFDRGSSLVASPLDLFSHERTLVDALQTGRAMAREVYKRNWTIEIAGFEKMVRAAWVEFQHLADQYGHELEILNFNPTLKDINVYREEAVTSRAPKKEL